MNKNIFLIDNKYNRIFVTHYIHFMIIVFYYQVKSRHYYYYFLFLFFVDKVLTLNLLFNNKKTLLTELLEIHVNK